MSKKYKDIYNHWIDKVFKALVLKHDFMINFELEHSQSCACLQNGLLIFEESRSYKKKKKRKSEANPVRTDTKNRSSNKVQKSCRYEVER